MENHRLAGRKVRRENKMADSISAAVSRTSHATDGRAHERSTMVLRVGLLESAERSSFCLLRNISPNGVQVKLYSPVSVGSDVNLRVGDENTLQGRIAWVQNGLAGITFKNTLNANTLLRVRQMVAPDRRRASPRAKASGFAILRTGGQEYSAKLCDISASGAKILTARSIDAGRTAVLLLPQLPALQAFVRWTHGQDTGLIFKTPIPIQVIADWLIDQPHISGVRFPPRTDIRLSSDEA